MPYIISTHQTIETDVQGATDNVCAVATLFEARDEAAYRIEQITGGDEDYESIYTDAQGCSELGDTFGPLPGGYVVEVQYVDWTEMIGLAGGGIPQIPESDEERSEILDAYSQD